MGTWNLAPDGPFGADVPRVPLGHDPLVRVVAQVQFTPVLSVREDAFVAGFQEDMRHRYPLLNREFRQRVDRGDDGMLGVSHAPIWRLSDVDQTWQVTLAEDFCSLDCESYTERFDFHRRLRHVLDSVGVHIRPIMSTRVGVRYTNLFKGEAHDRLGEFIRPELLGLAGTAMGSAEMHHHSTVAEFTSGDVTLSGRWGHMAPGTDPELLGPGDEPAWLLDLDAFTEVLAPFNPAGCAHEASRYASVVHRFFRWAVSDEFLDHYELAWPPDLARNGAEDSRWDVPTMTSIDKPQS